MDHDEIAYRRQRSGAWRLLRADHAPLVLATLGQVFIVDNVRSIAESALLERLEDLLSHLNARAQLDAGAGEHAPGEVPYPRSARAYLDAWAAPEQGWLRKYYPRGATEAHYDATTDVEKAWTFVSELQSRAFVATQSRLHTVIALLRQMVHQGSPDPTEHLASLHRQRAELDAEIARIEDGGHVPLDRVALSDHYQHFAQTARELLADFREVEDNFRSLDRDARAKVTAWEGAKGELLDELVGDRHTIAASDQGLSFQAFYEFLLSRAQQEELDDLLRALDAMEQLEVDGGLRHIHHDWMDAAERTQQMVRQLSEQLRRFLDDRVWLENRRVIDLLRGIERTVLRLRPPSDVAGFVEIEGSSPRVTLPFERPLYAPSPPSALDSSAVTEAMEEIDPAALFEQVHVDPVRLADGVRGLLRGRSQVGLAEVLDTHPPTQGVAEVVAYLGLTDTDLEVIIDDTGRQQVQLTDSAGSPRLLTLPRVTLARPGTAGGGRR